MVYQLLQRHSELQRLTLSASLTSNPNSPLQGGHGAGPGQGAGLFGLQDNSLHKPGVSVQPLKHSTLPPCVSQSNCHLT